MSLENNPSKKEPKDHGADQASSRQPIDLNIETSQIRAMLEIRQKYNHTLLQSSSIVHILLRAFSATFWRGILFVPVLLFIVYFYLFHRPSTQLRPDVDYITFKHTLTNAEVSSVTIMGDLMKVNLKKGSPYTTSIPKTEATELLPALIAQNVNIKFGSEPLTTTRVVMVSLGGVVLISVLVLYRSLTKASKQLSVPTFYRSPAKLMSREQYPKIKLKDVVLPEKVHESVQRLIDFLHDPKKYQRLGGSIDRGFLLFGPTGTGKTMLMKGLATEADASVFIVAGAEFFSGFPGAAVARVRDMFEQARRNTPSIIFIDEIDALVRSRSICLDPIQLEHEMALSELLAQMDSFDTKDAVVVIGATNRPDLVDVALIRPGRFDKILEMGYPSIRELEAIIRIHAKNVKLDPTVDFAELATYTAKILTRCSGAQAAEILNRAAKIAAEESKKAVLQEHLKKAADDLKCETDIFRKVFTR